MREAGARDRRVWTVASPAATAAVGGRWAAHGRGPVQAGVGDGGAGRGSSSTAGGVGRAALGDDQRAPARAGAKRPSQKSQLTATARSVRRATWVWNAYIVVRTEPMTGVDEGEIEWLDPWSPVRASKVRQDLEQELLREVTKGHAIFGRQATAIATRRDCDDVLFVLGESGQLAVVHLAFAAHPDRPPWPIAELFESVEDFVDRRMKPDHEDYTGAE